MFFVKNKKVYEHSNITYATKIIPFDKDVVAVYKNGDEMNKLFLLTEGSELYSYDYRDMQKLYEDIVFVSNYDDVLAMIDSRGKILCNIPEFVGPEDVFFTKVSISQSYAMQGYYLMAIDRDGNAWFWGSYHHGNYFSNLTLYKSDHLRQISQGIHFIDVRCCGASTTLLDIDGNFYGYGLGPPKLFTKDGIFYDRITKFDLGSKKVVYVSTTSECNIFVDDKQFTYGYGREYALGLAPYKEDLDYNTNFEITEVTKRLELDFVPVAINDLEDHEGTIMRDKEGNLYRTIFGQEGFHHIEHIKADAITNENPQPRFVQTKSARNF